MLSDLAASGIVKNASFNNPILLARLPTVALGFAGISLSYILQHVAPKVELKTTAFAQHRLQLSATALDS
jgi:hypothetical protein